MKKLIALALAVGALGAGTAAMAVPAVVAGTSPVYTDNTGHQFTLDQYGRQVWVQPSAQQIVGYDQWGRAIYGQPQVAQVYVNPPAVAYVSPPVTVYRSYDRRDRDGDGVPNWADRYPNNPRWQ